MQPARENANRFAAFPGFASFWPASTTVVAKLECPNTGHILTLAVSKAMTGANRFWLSLHQLSRDYLDEGLTPGERAQAIIEDFLGMPEIARRELLEDLGPLVLNLSDLYTMALAADRAEEAEPAEKSR